MKMRYVVEARPDWIPPRWVVVDALAGAVVSRHDCAADAAKTAKGLGVNWNPKARHSP